MDHCDPITAVLSKLFSFITNRFQVPFWCSKARPIYAQTSISIEYNQLACRKVSSEKIIPTLEQSSPIATKFESKSVTPPRKQAIACSEQCKATSKTCSYKTVPVGMVEKENSSVVQRNCISQAIKKISFDRRPSGKFCRTRTIFNKTAQ